MVLDKDNGKQAEGERVELTEVDKTWTGMRRYDVHMRNLRMAPYKSERLNHCGVAVLD